MDMTARRFISCYNEIDAILRDIAGIKPAQSFSEAVRVASARNAVVKRYADDLFAYARLRNAIVHSVRGDEIIAEPHEDVTQDFERILALLKRPPLVREMLGERRVVSVRIDAPLADAVMLIARHHYSNLPVVDRGRLCGLLTPKDIVTSLGVKMADGGDLDTWLDGATVGDVPRSARFCVLSRDATVPETAALFADRKLKAVILTRDGTTMSEVFAIVTPADLPAMEELQV